MQFISLSISLMYPYIYLGVSCGIQSEIAESEEKIDVVPDIVEQSGVQSGPIPLLIDYSHKE